VRKCGPERQLRCARLMIDMLKACGN
jgi:hypothetical protein